MKQKIKKFTLVNIYPILIVVIVAFFALPFLQKGLPVGHDDIPQIARTAARIIAISDGQIPSRWAGNLNYGFGHPGFIVFYSLPGYLGAIFYYLGINLETSYKLLMIATFILAPLFFYFWTARLFEKRVAFVISLLYGLSPYAFLDTFVRIHLGESLALVFIPLIFLFIEKNNSEPRIANSLLGGISYALLIHSHTILSFVFTFIFLAYIFVTGQKNKKKLISNGLMLVLGLLLSSYFIIPAILEGRYINSAIFLRDWYKNEFLNLGNIIYSKWGFGSEVNKPGGLSAQIGPVQFFLVLLGIFVLFKNKFKNSIITFWFSVFAIGFLMSLPISGFIWSHIQPLQQFQFPWRFTAVTMFAACIMAGYVLSFFRNKNLLMVVLLLILILAIPMDHFWQVQKPQSNSYYFNYPGTAAYHNEATTVWVAGDAYKYPKSRVQIIDGLGSVTNLVRKSNIHEFKINSVNNVRILDNTTYFPGWQVLVDNKKVPIQFQDMNYRGLITFNSPKGMHFVKVEFTETKIRLLSDLISLFGLSLIILIIAFRKRLDLKLKKL